MSVDEAAACLGVPAATVRTGTFRARRCCAKRCAREVDVATVHAFGFAGERCDRIVAGVLAALAGAGLIDFPRRIRPGPPYV
jgi:RNA polymerase sigma-70 factor (ECF subfamily)